MFALPHAVTAGALLNIEQENLFAGKPEYALYLISIFALSLAFHAITPLGAEYVTVFSGRTDTPEVRFDLTDKLTHRQDDYCNPPAHARRGLTKQD